MGQHTKIIDLYGLPGCGKTTLMTYLKDKSDSSIDFGYLPDITGRLKKNYVAAFFRAFSLRQFFLLTRFFVSLPILPIKNWNIYAGFYELSWVYNFARYCSDRDYILVDHGIVQSIGSLTYGHVETLPKKSEKYLVKLLGLFAIEEYCFCKITPEMALERIRKRNRQSGRGRLDLIKDDEKLVKELTKQDKLFSSISELVPQHTPGKSLVLNMNASESELGNRIIDELLICRI